MLQGVAFLLLLLIQCHLSDQDLECLPKTLRSVGLDFMKSFEAFKEKVQSFFHISFDKIEKRRLKIKNAFYNFLDESFGELDSDKRNLLALSEGSREEGMPAPHMITAHGYRVQSYTILTQDGFLLTLHRVMAGDIEARSRNKIALLHHGLFGSSDDWLILGKGRALPYLLSAAGYDVWLANARGNKYSRAHINRTVDEVGFWNFSWHEIGLYDLSAVIDYVVGVSSKNTEIHFIGHALGATSLLVLLSVAPKYNDILKSATFLAPLVYMYHVEGPLKILADSYEYRSTDNIYRPTLLRSEIFSPKVIERFCRGEVRLCLNPFLLLANGGQDFANSYITEAVLSHVPAGSSKKMLIHYLQLIKSGEFQMFDYGYIKNMEKYGESTPSSYDLNQVTVPVIIFSSSSDWLSTVPDIVNLLTKIHNVIVHHVVKKSDFSHTDFLWSNNAPELVYYLILDILQQRLEQKKGKESDTGE
ncbi:lipase 3-like [Manduca sexta]|uniref:Esterase n=1 Tax=Manduca sexta TaxID=7130 RepID=A0A921ZHK2_MANSE|nr:lipase 3-like [Manduca sexta]KAG6457964.1 hypothetical protein O3G_MSEX010591 [Manduca sexta]UXP71929.1 esterase [Manduca sexta]